MAIPRRTLDPDGRVFLFAIAAAMGLGAMSIDMLLPAFPELRAEVGLAEGSTAIAGVLTSFFVGIAVGQLVFGPLSDRYGRKRLLQIGLGVMIVGALATMVMSTLTGLVVCRFVWGLGAAAPRAISLAMVRDRMHGDQMARTMSILMAIFLIVPVIAPGIGAAVLAVGDWRLLVGTQVALIVAMLAWSPWFPETLSHERRRPVSVAALRAAGRDFAGSRVAVAFSLASMTLFGAIATYIGTSEVIFEEVFDAEALFPLMFGLIAVAMAFGSLLGSRLVARIGMNGVLKVSGAWVAGAATALLVLALATDGKPPMWMFVVVMAAVQGGMALLLPSCNTAAMGPLGHVAGFGSAVIGMVGTAGGALLGMVADAAYDGTVTPFAAWVLAFAVSGVAFVALGLSGRRLRRATAADVVAQAPVLD